VKDRARRDVVAYAVPVERRLASDMQSRKAALEKNKAWVQRELVVRPAIDAASQPLQPARPDIMDSQVGRYAKPAQVPAVERSSRCQVLDQAI
jgi:hypothetical protein